MTQPIIIRGIHISQDAEGRYRLNDLHKAAGSEERHKPSNWKDNAQTVELVQELTEGGISPLAVQKGGVTSGVYACKELVYAYATWISPAFFLHVIRTFDAVVTEQPQPDQSHTPSPMEQQTNTIMALTKTMMSMVPGLKPGIAIAKALNAVTVNTGLDVSALRELLPPSEHPTEALLNATQLGKRLGISGQKVNRYLADAGLQQRDDQGNWILTPTGSLHAEAMPFERNGHTGYQVVWRESVILLIETH